MADPHDYITDVGYHDNYPSFQGDIYGPYGSMFPEIRNTRTKIMNNLRGQQTINPVVLVEDMLKTDYPLVNHYEVIDIVVLLRKNIIGKRESEALQMIKTAVGILEKYGRNLLKPSINRPPKWKIIFFSNGVFKTKVGVVEGSKEILHQLGYTSPIADGLSFPDDINHPNEDQVLKIVTDLIIAKVEIEKYMNKLHPHPESLYHTLHGNSSPMLSMSDMYGPGSGLTAQMGSHSGGYSTAAIAPPSLATLGSTIYGTAATSFPNQSQPQTQFPQQSVNKPQGPSLSQVASPFQGESSSKANVHQTSISSGGSDYQSNDTDCNLCGEEKAAIYCHDCKNSNCIECDKVWHSHPKRHGHKTEPLNIKVDVEVKPEPDKYNQQIATQLKRPPSTLVYEKPAPPPDDQHYQPKDSTVISPLSQSNEARRKTPIPAPRKVSESSNDEPTTPASPSDRSSYLQMRSNDSSSHDSSVTSSTLHHTGSSTSSAKTKSPKDFEEMKQKLLRDCIAILEQVQLIQVKQDSIEDQDCDEYLVLEREREVLLSRHKSIEKRIKALKVIDTPKRGSISKKTTSQDSSVRPKDIPEVTLPELIQPLALNIKKPPVEDLMNMTPNKQPPDSEKAVKEDDAKLQLKDRESVLSESPSYMEGHHTSNQLKYPPDFYTPPAVPDPVPTPSVRPTPAVRKQLPKPQDVQLTDSQVQRHYVQPSVTNEIPEIGSQNIASGRILKEPVQQTAGWECQYCTFWNTDTNSFICGMCSKTTYRDSELSTSGGSGGARTSSGLTQQHTFGFDILTMEKEDDMLEKRRLEGEVKVKSSSEERSKTKETFSHTFPKKTDVTKRKSDEFLPSLGTHMTLTDMRMRTKQEETRSQGQQLVTVIRKAQHKDFDFETIEMALDLSKQNNIPVNVWLEQNYETFMETARVMVTNELNTIIPGSTVSEELLMDCLHKHNGDIEKAKMEYVEDFQVKIKDLEDLKLERKGHVLTTEEILQELTKTRGDVDQMVVEVQKFVMKEFCDRIWQDDPNMKDKFFDVAEKDRERKLRSLFMEYNLKSWGRAEQALKLINENKDNILEDPEYYGDVIQAVHNYQRLDEARNFLKKECSVCNTDFPMTRIWQSPFCQGGHQCLICRECVQGHFTVCIKDRNILDASCPSCNIPDLLIMEKGEVSQYFATIDLMLRSVLDGEVYDLLHRRLRDRELMDDKRFRWCLHCGSGFINERDVCKMQCPECKQHQCFECKKKWEPQHDNITCEQFEKWKEDNDPERQDAGLARHLQANGIDCPKCNMRYDLAKGGCMHFKCTQCKHEFCCGCNEKLSTNCARYQNCCHKGLHAHHPRDCLFYLRDHDVPELQQLLKNHDVAFDTEPKQQVERLGQCTVQEQKETPDGLKDEMCGKNVKAKNAGLCEVHYKEYLVGLINKKHIDPAEIFDAAALGICIIRHEMAVPDRRQQEAEDHYRQRLFEVVQEEFPLR